MPDRSPLHGPVFQREPVWILRQALLLKHMESLRLLGGAEWIRDEGALDSALMRPINAWSYGREARVATLAAGEMTEAAFADRLKPHLTPRTP